MIKQVVPASGGLPSRGSFTALPTPFREVNIDTDSLARLCERQINRGTAGFAGFRVEGNGSLTALGIFGVGGGLPVADGASGLAAY